MSWLAALLLSYLVTSGAWLPVSQASVIVFNTATNHTVVVYDSALADFGNKLHGKLLGNLSVAQPETACAPLLAPPGGVMAHFVLIRRGNCSFSDKVRHAQQARYAAAIIYNVNSDDIFHMQGEDASDVTIPSMMVGATCAHSIRQFLQSDRYIVVLTGWSPGDATDYLIPFIGVCLLCIAIMSCFLVSQLVHRCYQHYQRVRRSRLPARALASLPVKLYDKSASSSDTQQYDTCAICLEDFEQNDRLRILPCNHAYHCVCIDPWLTRSRRVCPICKRSVLASVFGSAGHSDSSSLEDEEEEDDGNDEDSSSVSTGHGERRPLITAGSAGTAGRGRSVASTRRAAASSATSYGSTRPTSHSVAPTHPSSSSRSSTLSSMTSRLPFRLFRRAETSLSSTEAYDGGDGGVMSGGVGVVAPSEPLLAHESSAQHTTHPTSGGGRRSRHHPPPQSQSQSQSVTAARQTATAAAASETAQGLSVVVVQAAAVERAPPATSSAVAVARPARRRRDRRRPVVASRGPVESQRAVSAGHENVTEDVITSPAPAAAAASQEDVNNTTSADCIV